MTDEFRKEAYRLFWLVKGHLGCHTWSDKEIESMHDSYFRRLWRAGSDGAPLYEREEGFEEAYEEIIGTEHPT